MGQAVYVVEFRSISHGIGVLDRMLKRAGVCLLHADPICIGKYLICVGGDVADVREAQDAATQPDPEGSPLASYLLTGAHPSILAYFEHGAPQANERFDAIGIFETYNASSGFMSLDAALKSAQVRLLRVWLGQFLGGKYCFVLGGSTSDVTAAIRAASSAVAETERVGSRVIPSPDEKTMALFLRGGTGQ